MKTTEQSLAERFRQGDEDAFYELYKQLGNAIFSFALRMTGSREDAEDAAVRTFTEAHRCRTKFAGQCSLATPKRAEAAWVNVKKAVQSISSVEIHGEAEGQPFTTYIVPGARRAESSDFILVYNQDGCSIVDPSGNPAGNCGGPTPDPSTETFEAFKRFQGTPTYIGDVQYQGRTAQQFELSSSFSKTIDGETSTVPTRYRFLVDPSTQLPIRGELAADDGSGETLATWNYKFNAEIPAEAFETPTPAKK